MPLVAEVTQTPLPEPLTAIFYDITSLDFESEQGDELRRQGSSKDGKPHRVPVLCALRATPEGLPVGDDLLPDARYEGNILGTAPEALERHLVGGGRFTGVADAGMIN